MKFSEEATLRERLHHLIRLKATGSPKQLARRLDMSKRNLFRLIYEMRNDGFPIAYDRIQENSMAMFTQANHKTSVDFRKYDMANPTRCIPYNLPSETENKLVQLFKNLNLKMGSVDLIKCKSTNEIYFLEINPEGQYDMVSSNCNYNLHEKIALKLINIDNEFKR